MRFGRDTFITLLTLGATTLLGMAFSVLTARLLGPEGRGILTLVFLIPSVGVTMVGFGLGSANVYFLNRGGAPRGTLIANSLLAAPVFSLFAVLLFWLGWDRFAPRILPGVTPGLAAMGLAVVPLALMNTYVLSFLQGAQRFIRMNIVSIAAQALALATLLVALLGFHARVGGAVIAQLLAVMLAFLLSGWALLSSRDGDTPLRPDLSIFRRSMAYGLREHASNLSMFLSYRIDIFFIASMAGARAVGQYAIAVMTAELFLYLPRAVCTVLFPHAATHSPADAGRNVARSARVVSIVVGLSVLAAAPLAGPLVRFVFSDAYAEAVPALVALLPGIYALSISRVLSAYFTGALGEPGLNAKAAAVSLGLNLPLNVLLIPQYGIVGAAVASSVAYGAHFLVSLWIFCRRSGFSPSEVLIPRAADLAWIVRWMRGLRPIRWGVSHV